MQRVSDVYSRGLIRALLPLTLITCGLWLSGCGASKAAIRIGKAWPSVHMGMSESDVRNILGKPTSSENNYEYKDGIGRKNECWKYPAGGLHYYQVCFSNGTSRPHHHHAFRVAAKNYYG
jgi:hypothetical protein